VVAVTGLVGGVTAGVGDLLEGAAPVVQTLVQGTVNAGGGMAAQAAGGGPVSWRSAALSFGLGGLGGVAGGISEKLGLAEEVNRTQLSDESGRLFTHFTDETGVTGIMGTAPPPSIGQSVSVSELNFGRGYNPFLASEPGRIFVTDLSPTASPRELEAIGVFGVKQAFAIQFSERDAFESGARVVGEVPSRGIYSLPGGSTITGLSTVTRLR
jgi:hypothetical protein